MAQSSEAAMFDVVFFKTIAGNVPVLDWLRGLPVADRAVIGTDLRTVQLGFPIGMPVCRPLGKGLYEVRSSLPSLREARLLFFQGGRDLVIVAGFIKKTQALPAAERTSAETRMRHYLSQKEP